MRDGNVVNEAPMLSAIKAADYLNLSDNAFFPAIKAGWIIPQAELRRPGRHERAFVVEYLDDVKRVLPAERGKGFTIFTEGIVMKLVALNSTWLNRQVDWKKDMAKTERAMAKISKPKKKR